MLSSQSLFLKGYKLLFRGVPRLFPHMNSSFKLPSSRSLPSSVWGCYYRKPENFLLFTGDLCDVSTCYSFDRSLWKATAGKIHNSCFSISSLLPCPRMAAGLAFEWTAVQLSQLLQSPASVYSTSFPWLLGSGQPCFL